jgi:predicted component of type VI protein secretion system
MRRAYRMSTSLSGGKFSSGIMEPARQAALILPAIMWILQTPESCDTGSFTFRLLPGSIKTVGRATRADFVLDVALVSRFHCRLTAFPNGTLEVEDLRSTNGTYVNDTRVQRLALAEGDRLRVGRVELHVARG